MRKCIKSVLLAVVVIMAGIGMANAAEPVKKLLVIGDSMTGWLGERLTAYGNKNGYEVMTVVWDGATVSKYANSGRLAGFIKEKDPDAVVVCLGMNEMLGRNFDKTVKPSLDKFRSAVGDRQLLWVGPPSWPGKGDGKAFHAFMTDQLGVDHYFDASKLKLPRQSKSNPHPTRAGMIQMADAVIDYCQSHDLLNLPGYVKPAASETAKSKVYIYKRMKERF